MKLHLTSWRVVAAAAVAVKIVVVLQLSEGHMTVVWREEGSCILADVSQNLQAEFLQLAHAESCQSFHIYHYQ